MRAKRLRLIGLMAFGLLVWGCDDDDDDGGSNGGATDTAGGDSATGGDAPSDPGGEVAPDVPGATGTACITCATPLTEDGSGSCDAQQEACDADPDCQEWNDCLEPCVSTNFTAECFDACDAAHPDSAALWGAHRACLCATCSAECGPFCE